MTKEEYHNVLNNIAGSFGTLKDQVNQAFEIGRALGLSDMQIGNDVRSKIKGLVSVNTIQRMLPQTAKHMEHASKHKSEPTKLIGSKQPNIPPRPEVVREAEIVRQPEPPKPIAEPITIPQRDTEIIKGVVFDPAPIDRDRTQVFIMDIDPIAKKVIKYKTVGRRSVR